MAAGALETQKNAGAVPGPWSATQREGAPGRRRRAVDCTPFNPRNGLGPPSTWDWRAHPGRRPAEAGHGPDPRGTYVSLTVTVSPAHREASFNTGMFPNDVENVNKKHTLHVQRECGLFKAPSEPRRERPQPSGSLGSELRFRDTEMQRWDKSENVRCAVICVFNLSNV